MDVKEKKELKATSQQRSDAFVLKFAKILLILNVCLLLFSLGNIIWGLKEEGKFSFSSCGVMLVFALNIYVGWRNMKGRSL